MTRVYKPYTSPIDPHVHCRWNEYPEDYLKLAHRDANAVGLAALCEMPNTTPPLADYETLNDRIDLAGGVRCQTAVKRTDGIAPLHFIHGAITTDPEQARQMIRRVKAGTL